jgi:hypothetical protein
MGEILASYMRGHSRHGLGDDDPDLCCLKSAWGFFIAAVIL